VTTKTPSAQPPAGYDPSLFPAFAVTVRSVILTMVERTPVIDRTYRLEDVVEAHRYVETRQKTGNVVLSLNGGPR
jgi:hypothetical protein